MALLIAVDAHRTGSRVCFSAPHLMWQGDQEAQQHGTVSTCRTMVAVIGSEKAYASLLRNCVQDETIVPFCPLSQCSILAFRPRSGRLVSTTYHSLTEASRTSAQCCAVQHGLC